jgi:hypothetical protein
MSNPNENRKIDVFDIIIAGKSDDVKGHEQSLGRNNSGKDVRQILQVEWQAPFQGFAIDPNELSQLLSQNKQSW